MGNIVFSSAVNVSRPIRLKESTRRWCREMLSGTYGKELKKTPFVTLDDVENFDRLNTYEKHDLIVNRIAEQCPVYIREDELIVGSATLYAAAYAQIPAQYHGQYVIYGTNHTTYNFAKVLERGVNDLEKEVRDRMAKGVDHIGEMTLNSVLAAVSALRVWHGRYMSKLSELIKTADSNKQKEHYISVYENLKDMPFEKPQSFRQALQSLWFIFIFTRLLGNFPGLGKIDRMLEPFLKSDLETGRLTMEEARELMAHFFIKGVEWTTLDVNYSGDGMFFQNIVLAGTDRDGNETAGLATRLILETVEELPIGDYPIGVRIHRKSPEWLLRKCAEISRHGTGVIAVYNEDTVIRSLESYGYSREDASNFSNDGCWEVLIQGKTLFGYYPMDAMNAFQIDTLHLNDTDGENRIFGSFEELFAETKNNLHKMIDHFQTVADTWGQTICHDNPTALSGVASLLVDGCIDKARDYLQGGPVFCNLSPHFGGLGDVANDLYVFKKAVFEEKIISFSDLVTILKNDWEGNEVLMNYVRNNFRYYGNDNDEVDSIMADLVSDFADYTMRVHTRNGVSRAPGVSSFGRQVGEWRENRYATASGRRKNDILSGNICPAPMTDYNGPTAIIKSCCKCSLEKLVGGTALDLNLEPVTVRGEEGVDSIIALYRGFVELNGWFLHLNVVDPAEMEDAVIHPENHQNLTVRVSGWSSRFVTVDANYQKMLIERAKNGTYAS